MNGKSLLNFAEGHPNICKVVKTIGNKNCKNVIRDTKYVNVSTTVDSVSGDVLGSIRRINNQPLTFHYGKLDGQPTIDVYTGSCFSNAKCDRYTYNTLGELKKIVEKAYESLKGEKGSMIM